MQITRHEYMHNCFIPWLWSRRGHLREAYVSFMCFKVAAEFLRYGLHFTTQGREVFSYLCHGNKYTSLPNPGAYVEWIGKL